VSGKSVAAVILGGGAGTRLYPLTKQRAKPAVPIGGAYRLIDVPMSNCINSGISKMYVLTQVRLAGDGKDAGMLIHVCRAPTRLCAPPPPRPAVQLNLAEPSHVAHLQLRQRHPLRRRRLRGGANMLRPQTVVVCPPT
jgi:hypothetical protein